MNRELSISEKLEKELSLKELQIKSLLTITQAINDNVSTDGLFNMYRSFLSWEMGIDKMILFVKGGEDWNTATFINVEEEYHDSLIEECEQYKRLHTVKEEDHPSIKFFDIIIPVYHKDYPIAYALIGGIKDKEDIYNKIQFITTITNIIAVAIENKRLFKKQIEQEKLNKEMELAKEFQQRLIPEKIPESEFYEVHTYYKPHFNIGGDYIDFMKFSDNRFAVVIADISGKGVAAALLMSNFQAMLQSLIFQYRDLETFVFALNQAVYRITKSDKFITFFVAEIDTEKKELRYINAGHYPPILYNEGKMSELKTGSTVIGAFEKLPFINEEKITLAPDALLFCFTDGLVDIQNEEGDYFDEEKLKKFISDNKNQKLSEFNANLINTLETFKGKNEYVDDIALLATKVF
ncbi:MAG: serine/threonine-protein phosphatase [Saprospiraceae bacterium]|nr:serine/threonine-protein phosphatase [Bacteroidia bacterium]NNE13382.1 serine/threonine-protein phosphatase [Saprospiraceae bacterium]NNL91069.1 serine/threonine-protein phosphatase [Saprospiraceae bacterium]